MPIAKLDNGNKTITKKPTLSEEDFSDTLNANGLYTRNQIDRFNRFSRFGFFDPYNTHTLSREYIFFTKPDLHLFDGKDLNPEISSIPFFSEAFKNHKDSMIQLQSSAYFTTGGPFCNLLTNSVVSTLDLDDISIETVETAANTNATKLEYPMATLQGNNTSFNLEFEDTKYLDVYMFFRIWYEYELQKQGGMVSPPDIKYTINKVLHNQMGCYKFIVGEDSETIIHYSKLWGVFPTSVPRSVFGDLADGPIKFSVGFKAQFIEDMDPMILSDFNKVVEPTKNRYNKDMPVYNIDKDLINGKWCHIPYIVTSSDHGRPVYKMKWR